MSEIETAQIAPAGPLRTDYWAMTWDESQGRFVLFENLSYHEMWDTRARYDAYTVGGYRAAPWDERETGSPFLEWTPTPIWINESIVFESQEGLATTTEGNEMILLAPSQSLAVRRKLPPRTPDETRPNCDCCGVLILDHSTLHEFDMPLSNGNPYPSPIRTCSRPACVSSAMAEAARSWSQNKQFGSNPVYRNCHRKGNSNV